MTPTRAVRYVYIDRESDTKMYLCSTSEEDSDSDVVLNSSSDEDDDEVPAIAGAHQWAKIELKNIPPNALRFLRLP